MHPDGLDRIRNSISGQNVDLKYSQEKSTSLYRRNNTIKVK